MLEISPVAQPQLELKRVTIQALLEASEHGHGSQGVHFHAAGVETVRPAGILGLLLELRKLGA